MRYNQLSLLRYGLPVAVLGLGALMLVPGNDESTVRASSVAEVAPRTAPSYLAASPDLVRQLEASLAPPVSTENVAAREAARPEPLVSTTVPVAPEVLAAARAPETAVEATNIDPDKALRVGDSGVNMRVGPSTTTGVIRTLKPGEQLAMSEAQGSWVSVTTEDGESGWVYASYLNGPALAAAGVETEPKRERVREAKQAEEPHRSESRREGRTARVAQDTYLRAGPSQGTERLFVLPAGERVTVAERRGGWARVVLRSGASGWVRVR